MERAVRRGREERLCFAHVQHHGNWSHVRQSRPDSGLGFKRLTLFPTRSETFYVVPDSLSEYLTRFKLFPIRSEVEGTLLWRAASDRDRKSVFAWPWPASRRYIFFIRILPESQGKNQASTVFFVPYSLDSGPCCGETRPMGMGRASLLCPRPASCKLGTWTTVRAGFWPWRSGKSPSNVLSP